MIEWPPDLQADIARRRSVLFLGAGVSKNSQNDAGERPKDWREFLTFVAERVADGEARETVDRCIQSNDYLMAAEVAKNAVHQDVLNTILLSEYAQKRFQPSQIHEDLVAIDSRLVLTTNFDKLYEISANRSLHGDVVVKTYLDVDVADTLRRQIRCVLKVHGTIDTPGSSIITRSDYARARSSHAGFYRVLDALFLTHTFVFLGVSLNDPDMRLLLEDYAWRYPGTRPHYVVTSDNAWTVSEREVIERSMNVRFLTYSSENHHEELLKSLAELRLLVLGEREELSRTANW